MKKTWFKSIATVSFAMLFNSAIAAPSAEIEQELLQTDGSIVNAIQKGDEWDNWIETTGGYPIEKLDDSNWYYITNDEQKSTNSNATQASSNQKIRADLPPPSGLKKGIRKAKDRPEQAPEIGFNSDLLQAPNGNFTGKILFILTEFTNRLGTTTEASWANFVSNNIADYYNKASYGKVTLQPANETSGTSNNGIINWVNVGYNHPNTGGSTGAANRTLARDAIVAANPYINYASYDANSDGYVDSDELAIVIIAAGYDTSYGGTASALTPRLWGHKWSASPAPTVDGVTVGAYHSQGGGYAQFGELHATSVGNQHQATMGIMVHELGHLIFAYPDLYDTDQSSSGIGAFGVMGGGSWGRQSSDTHSGATPVFPSAWSQLQRGWVDGAEGYGTESITAAGSTNATSANTVFKASTSNSNQFFLVQNRQNQGYDRGLERWLGNGFSGGLNIFHVDNSKTNNTNDVNRWVDVEEADGTQMGTTRGENSDLWRSGNATSFNDTTTPNSKLNGGASTSVDINSISTTGSVMTATFGSMVTPPNAATLISPSGNITDTTPTYTWNAVSNATWYYLWVNDSSGNKIKTWYTSAQASCTSGTGTCSITPSTSLVLGDSKWWIQTWNSAGHGAWSSTKNFSVGATTAPATVTLVSPNGTINNSTPTYTWNAVANSSWYYLWVNDSSGNRIKKWYTAAQAGCAPGTGTCSVTHATTLNLGAGKWWVRSWNNVAYGSWSAPMDFNRQ